MLNILTFLLFYLYHYLNGRGILIFFEKVLGFKNALSYKINNFPLKILYPLFSLFYIGQLVLLFNFFMKGYNLYVIVFSILPLLMNLFSIQTDKINLKNNFLNIITLIVLSVSSNTISFHQDAASYHLNNQLYIRTEKIVLGLSNVYMRYGYSSLSEYINSFFWYKNNFIFVHFVNLIFLSVFYHFLKWCLLDSKNNNDKLIAIALLTFGVLDNFGIEGGRNGYIDIDTIGKQDNSFAILFFISNFFIIKKFKDMKIETRDFYILFFLILFSAELRFFGFVSFIGLFYITRNNLKLFFSKKTFIFYAFGIIWVFKNYLITSCLIYPITHTCINSPWFNIFSSNWQSAELRSFHIAYNILSENPIQWIFRWNERYLNYYVGINFLISITIIYLLLQITMFRTKESFNLNLKIYIYILFIFVLWMVSAPSIRFGIGIFMLIVSSFTLKHVEFRNIYFKNLFQNSLITQILFLMALFSTPLIRNYEPNNFEYSLKIISPPVIEYEVKLDTWGYGVKIIESEKEKAFCWLNKECTPPPDFIILEESFYGYRLMKLIK